MIFKRKQNYVELGDAEPAEKSDYNEIFEGKQNQAKDIDPEIKNFIDDLFDTSEKTGK